MSWGGTPMTISLIERVEAGHVLKRAEAEAAMEELLSGRVKTPEIVRLLEALSQRPVEVQELAGFARVMRRHATRVFAEGEALPANMVDTCGTGGDGANTFNISTAAAIVAAAAGARVAKHGNRAASSRSGSADVLEALGVRIDLPFERYGRAIREIGIGFLFAQAAHTATRHAAPARKQIGVRTVFNLLGPLTNPAGAQSQVLGVFSEDVIDPMAATLAELGVERAFVVHGAGGLDEISLAGETMVEEGRPKMRRSYGASWKGKPDQPAISWWSMLPLRLSRRVWLPIFAKRRDSRASSSPKGGQARNWRVWPLSPAGLKWPALPSRHGATSRAVQAQAG